LFGRREREGREGREREGREVRMEEAYRAANQRAAEIVMSMSVFWGSIASAIWGFQKFKFSEITLTSTKFHFRFG
jgi:hypothetical protein